MKALTLFFILGTITALFSAPPSHRLEAKWWADRLSSKLRALKESAPRILFLGDSITQGFEKNGLEQWKTHLAPLKAASLAMSGDRTEHTIWILQNLKTANLSPELVVINIGTNNTGHHMQAPAEVAKDIETIIDLVATKLPDSKILLLGVFPRDAAADGEKRANNKAINALISQITHERLTYLDLSSSFIEAGGTISPDIMPDELHLSTEGYQRWVNGMMPTVNKLLK